MDKKLFTILLVAIFLVASVGFVCAADSSDDGDSQTISVKINWKGDSQSDRPSSITVNLIKDGKIVDTAVLSEGNSWSAEFSASGDGSYSVKQASDLSGYSITTSGSASNGFVITNTLENDVLAAADDNVDDTNNDEVLEAESDETALNATNDEASPLSQENETDSTNNATDENETEETTNTTEETEDDNSTDDTSDDSQDDVSTTQSVKVVEKKVIKKLDKKPKNVTKNQLRNTGIPIIGLVIVAFAAAFIPFTRKK